MRAEIIAGGLLLMTGAFGGLLPLEETGAQHLFTGQAQFTAANYTGTATLQTSDGTLRLQGTLDDQLTAEQARLTLRTWNETGNRAEVAGLEPNVWKMEDTRETHEHFKTATIRIDSGMDGQIHTWASPEKGPGNFTLYLDPSDPPSIQPSRYGVEFWTDGQARTNEIEAPVFALGHDGSAYREAEVQDAVFDAFQANGSLTLVVGHANLTVQDSDEMESYRTGTWSEDSPGSPVVRTQKRAIAILELEGASWTRGFEEEHSTFFAYQPRWEIDGSVSFHADAGSMQSPQGNHSLSDRHVEILGNTTLDLKADGEEDKLPLPKYLQPDHRKPEPLMPRPAVLANFQSQADTVTLDGQAVALPAQPPVPEEVTMLARVLGLLVLAWTVGRKFLFGVVALLVRDPLTHDRRRQIHRFVEEAGMAYLRQIHRATGIPLGSLAYHVRVLRKAGLLASIRRAGYTVYFATSPDVCQEEMERLALLAEPTRREIAEVLVEEAPLSQKVLARRLEVTQATISRQLAQLTKAGLVEARGKLNIEYRPADILRDWIGNGSAPSRA